MVGRDNLILLFFLFASVILITAGCIPRSLQQPKEGCIFGNCQDGLSIRRDRSGFYVGQLSRGKREGTGCYREDQGSRFFGDWLADQKNGQGTYVLPTGSISGQWFAGVPLEVTYHGADGTFSGRMKEDGGYYQPYLFPVEGLLRWPAGDQYKGGFGCAGVRCGLPHGDGEYYGVSGEAVKGHFNANRQEVGTNVGMRKYTLKLLDAGSPIAFRFIEIDPPLPSAQ